MTDISVIIPTYKPGEYIQDCLMSLYNQTLDRSKYQVVLILNGCNEPYQSELDNFISSQMSEVDVGLIQTDVPGVSNARNLGLQNIKGDYIAFIDDDDIISPNYLKALLERADKNIVSVSNVKVFTDDISITTDDYISRAFERYKERPLVKSLEMRKFLSSACAKLVSKDIIHDHLFDTNLKNSEDAVFMLEVSKNIKAIKFCTPDVIYYRRARQESASRKLNSFRAITMNYLCAFKKCLTLSMKKPFEYNHILILVKLAALVRTYLKIVSGR